MHTKQQVTEQSPDIPIMDREWERQQIKSFTAWMNLHGKKRGCVINDIREDLRDGRKLLQFLHIISGEETARPEKGNLRVHQINNVRHALDFIAKKGVKLVGTGAEEIVDGNLKMTLGMIWILILRYAINVIDSGASSASDGLLLWVKKKTEGYKGVNVTNFTTSFSDGLALNALIHRHRPDLLDYNKLNKEDPGNNLQQAFDIAEQHLEIPPMLEVDDMLISPDPKSVMTYVASFYHAFSRDQVTDNAQRRIKRILDNNTDNAAKVAEYERIASGLLEWINAKSNDFKEEIPDDSQLDDLLRKVDGMNGYKKDEKPPKAKEKATLESLVNTLKTRMHLQKRPDFIPMEGHGIKDIQKAWKDLEKLEKTRLDRLYLLIQHLYYLDHLLKKYMYKCDQQDQWVSGKLDPFSGDVDSMLYPEVLVQKKRVKALHNDLGSRESRLKLISSLHKRLKELNCRVMDQVDSRYDHVQSAWKELKDGLDTYHDKLKKREAALAELDELKQSYALKVIELKNFLDEANEDLNDTYQVQSVKEIEEVQKDHREFMEDFNKRHDKLNEILSDEDKIRQSSDPSNLYTNITGQELNEKYENVKNAGLAREQMLESEHQRQVSNEKLQKEFAAIAEVIETFKNECHQRVLQAPDQSEKLEDHLEILKKVAGDVDEFYREKFPTLQQLHQDLQTAQVFHNPFTTLTMEAISTEYQHLMDSIASFINEVENQIIVRDSSGISEQQVKEYKKSFDYFDKDHDNFLTHEEFRPFLISLEFNVSPDTEAGEAEFQRTLSKVDPDKSGQITFNNFLNFIATETKDTDTAEQMIESFKVLAGGKKYITPDIIKKEFPERADDIISKMSPSTVSDAPAGALDYESFAASLYGETEL